MTLSHLVVGCFDQDSRETAIARREHVRNVVERRTDGRFADGSCGDPSDLTGEKVTDFTLDPLGREVRTEVDYPATATDRRFDTTYWPSGARRTQVKRSGSGASWTESVTQSFFHRRDGRLVCKVRDPSSGDPVTQDYSYDANGNRTEDERGTHTFNARDQLVEWTRRNGRGSVDYTLNGAGAITEKVDRAADGTERSRLAYTAVGDRVESVSVTMPGATAVTFEFDHDELGNVEEISSATDPAAAETFTYDGFNRLRSHTRGSGGGASSYTYDALDRRDSELRGGVRSDLSYVGMSESLSQRERAAGETKRFDYDASMGRLGVATSDATGSVQPYRSYATDANGSVVGLEGDDGVVAAQDRYEYDPYGALQSDDGSGETEPGGDAGAAAREAAGLSSPAEDVLSADAAANPFRFQGHYADAGEGTYDMQARTYRPGVGRFLSEDRFEQASGDFALQADPLTQNRYAFAGGNPVSNIEFDGHRFGSGGGIGGPRNRNGSPDQDNDARTGTKVRSRTETAREASIGWRLAAFPEIRTDPEATSAPPDDVGPVEGFFDGVNDVFKGAAKGAGFVTGLEVSDPRWECLNPRRSCNTLTLFDNDLGRAGRFAAAWLGGGLAGRGLQAGFRGLAGRRSLQGGASQGAIGAKAASAACGMKSFSGGTRVLMADGTAKGMSELRAGDEVLAADPVSGRRGARRVLGVWVHNDTLLDLKVDGGVVATTEDHPFWNATDDEWQDIAAFDLGDALFAADGGRVVVKGFRAGSARAGLAYNLTVDDLHSYFVFAGADAILVHNANLRPCGEWADDFITRSGGDRVTITPERGQVLGPVQGYPAGDWRYHVAVRKGGKIYDQRNPKGVTPEEYKSQFEYRHGIDFGGM